MVQSPSAILGLGWGGRVPARYLLRLPGSSARERRVNRSQACGKPFALWVGDLATLGRYRCGTLRLLPIEVGGAARAKELRFRLWPMF